MMAVLKDSSVSSQSFHILLHVCITVLLYVDSYFNEINVLEPYVCYASYNVSELAGSYATQKLREITQHDIILGAAPDIIALVQQVSV
jgi:hypothetical protein